MPYKRGVTSSSGCGLATGWMADARRHAGRPTRPEGPGPHGPRPDAPKIPQLREALAGNFTAHHAFLLQMMLDRIDGLTARVDEVTARIEEQIAPYARAVEQLDEIAGVGVTSSQELIAEIGVDVSSFPTAGHLVSWVKFAPIDRSSAGKSKGGSTGKVNP